jgi:hypothetical protein
MRMFIFLAATVAVSALSLFASADSSHGLSLGTREAQSEGAHTNMHCAKKVFLDPGGLEVGCLMQKRRGRA